MNHYSKWLVLSLGLLLSSCSKTLSDLQSDGDKNLTASIVKGVYVDGSRPEQQGIVAIRYKKPGEPAYIYCQGILMNNRWVLLASSCGPTYIGSHPEWFDIIKAPNPSYGVRPNASEPEYQVANIAEAKLGPSNRLLLLKTDNPMLVNASYSQFRQPLYQGSNDVLKDKDIQVYSYGLRENFTESTSYALRTRIASLAQADFTINDFYNIGSEKFACADITNGRGQSYHAYSDFSAIAFLKGTNILVGVNTLGLRSAPIPSEMTKHCYSIGSSMTTWINDVTNTELRKESADLVTLIGKSKLSGEILATFSDRAAPIANNYFVYLRQAGHYLAFGKTQRIDTKNDDGQIRDIYKISIDDYDLDITKCGILFGKPICELNITVFNIDSGRSLSIENWVLVK